MINQNISGIIPAFIFLFLLFLLSACGDDRNQGSVFERGDAGRADSDSLLFMQYTERLGYHYSVRSDSVLWYIDELIGLAQRNNKQLEVLRFTAGKAFAYLNAGEYALALEYFQQAFEMAQNPEIENHYWTLGNDASAEKRRLRLLSNLHFTYGHLMYLTENSEERLNQYRIANRIAIENSDMINEAYTSDGLAMVYLEKNEPDSALIFINRSLELSEQLPSRFYHSYASWIQGNIYMNLEEFDRAYRSYSAGRESARNESRSTMRDKLTGDGGPETGYIPKLTVRTKSENGHITIEIEDNGPGIPDDIKDKIMQPFFTTKKGTQGTGLGLSITNDIIKAHGGELSVNSTSGSGSTFIITLKT